MTRWLLLVGIFVLVLPAGFGQVGLVCALTVSLVAILWALSSRHPRVSTRRALAAEPTARAVVLVGGFFAAATEYVYLQDDVPTLGAVILALAVVVGTVAVAIVPGQALPAVVPGAVLLLMTTLVVTVLVGPHVTIDVASLIDGAARDLLHGRSPYGGTTPNPYDATNSSLFLAPELVRGDQILIGYPYLPASLLTELPGVLVGQLLVSHIVVLALLWLVWWRSAADDAGRRLTVLAIASPMSLPVVLNAWVEPMMMLCVALLCYGLARGWRVASVVAVGYLFLSKQYVVVCLPVLWVIRRQLGVRAVVAAVAGAALVGGAFLCWDPGGFVHDVVKVHLLQPFRSDSISLMVVLSEALGRPPGWVLATVPLVAGFAVATLVAIRREHNGVTAALTIGLSTWVTVLLSKQGHANYYVFVQASLTCAFLAWPDETMTPADSRDTIPAGGFTSHD